MVSLTCKCFQCAQNIRIRHTIILDDPFEDPPQLAEHIPEQSPEPVMVEVKPLNERHEPRPNP